MTAGLIVAFLAYLLIYAGVKGVHPWAPVVEAFGGRTPPTPGRTSTSTVSPPEGQVTTPSETGTGTGSLTPRAAACKAAIEQTYPRLTYRGGFVCRTINPHNGGDSDEWSEHAWGNAIDFGEAGQEATMSKLMVWANLNRVRFKIANIVGPGTAVKTVHIDFAPSHTGQTPPCAG